MGRGRAACTLLETEPSVVSGKRVLELGAGTGVAGISAALLGARSVTLTDLDYCLPSLEVNANASGVADIVSVQLLDWLKPDVSSLKEIDVILAADVIWLKKLVQPLVELLERLAQTSSRGLKIVLSHQTRSTQTDAEMFARLARSFTTEKLPSPVPGVPDKLQLYSVVLTA